MLVDRVVVFAFLRSFFKNKESTTKYVSIEVQRGTERVAVDVIRGSEGNFNTVSKSSEKVFEPPYYREWFNATELDLYDRMMGTGELSIAEFTQFMESMSDKLQLLIAKIERAYELQCASVLETGILTLNSGETIDFGRKAGSLVANAVGNTWATGTVDPYANLEAGANFLRTDGKSQGAVVNVIFGATAWQHFCNNTIVKERADIRNFSLDNVRTPQKNSVGGVLHGECTIGSYRAQLWTYPEYYENSGGTMTPYLNPKKVIMLPEAPRFTMAFAAVPQVLSDGEAIKKGAFIVGEKIDKYDGIHKMDVKSAGVAIPTAVDQIYTLAPVA